MVKYRRWIVTEDWLKIIKQHGMDNQIKHWFSEVYELVQAIERYDGSLNARRHVIEELADNFNFLKQIQTWFDIRDNEVENIQRFKNARTLDEMEVSHE